MLALAFVGHGEGYQIGACIAGSFMQNAFILGIV